MNLSIIYKEVAKELNISVDVVEKTYNGYWKAIHRYISSMPASTKTSINIPRIGKFHIKDAKHNKN